MESEEGFRPIFACILQLIIVFLPSAESFSCIAEIPDKWCSGSPNWVLSLASCPDKPVIPDAQPVTIEIRVIYKCKNGKLFDGSQLYAQKTCGGPGGGNASEWLGHVDPCKDVNCRAPPTIDNATYSLTNSSLNGQATYQCDPGFELFKGDTTLKCQDDGKWAGAQPVCRRILCPASPVPTNGKVCVSSNLPGGVATYGCNTGYRMKPSPSTSQCTPTGRWTGTMPVCERVSCNVATAVPYTKKESPKDATLGDVTKYQCISGYRRLKGDHEKVCQENSTWSGENLICKRVPCPTPLVLPKSTMIPNKTSYVFEDFIRYSCHPGFEKIHGDSNRNCQADGKWSGIPPFCQVTGCLEPAEFPGVVRLTNTSTWSTDSSVSFACDTGFTNISGDADRTCLKNGSWSGSPLVCKEIVCPCLEPPRAALMNVTNYLLGGVASFECLPGYVLSGGVHSICTGDGSWKGTNPTCTKMTCPVPPDVPYTTKKVHGVNVDQTVSYSCRTGYKLVRGDLVWSCLITGLWKGDVPICDVIECPSPEDIPNTKLLTTLNNFVVNTSIRYECDSGYQIASGNQTRLCENNGAWSGVALHCKEIECPEIPPLLNGTSVTSGQRYGDVVAFSCRTGYYLSEGSLKRFCVANKTWTGQQPVCAAVTCPPPPNIVNAELAVSPQTSYRSYESVRYACLSGYEHTRGGLGISCLPSGSWSDNIPVCTEIKCPEPTAMPNGLAIGHGVGLGDVTTYQCNTGYKISTGELYSFCLANKTWSSQPPSCKKVTCPSPPMIQNGNRASKTASFVVNDTVSFLCLDGYEVTSGDNTWRCKKSGTWSGALPVCEAISCQTPVALENSIITLKNNKYGDQVFYKCMPGYTAAGGNEVRSCQANGSWSGTPLKCSVISCQDPETIPNAILNSSTAPFVWNSTISYICDIGFELPGGDLIRNCSIEGTWTGTLPICREVSCGNPTSIQRGFVMYNGVAYGDIAIYKCDDGYKLTGGSEKRNCLANGTWSGGAPSCYPFSCNAPLAPGHVKVVSFPKSYVFNSTVEYDCQHGYEHKGGNLTRVCESNSKWSGDPPDCQEISCGSLTTNPHMTITQNGFYYRAVAIYACVDGYSRDSGDVNRECLANGTWSGVALACKQITCSQPETTPNANFATPVKADYIYAEKVSYVCDPGYEVAGGDVQRTCLSEGRWSGIPLMCKAKSCGDPNVLTNTTVMGTSILFESKMRYSCVSTYKQTGGDASRTCQADGVWSGSPLVCQRTVCPKPMKDSLGLLEYAFSGLHPGDTVIYFCKTGLEGERRNMTIAHCMIDGTWSREPPRCTKIKCRVLEPVTNASQVLVGGDVPGANVSYTCDIGYALEGSSIRLCLADGTWSGYPPSCRRIDCGFPECARFSTLGGGGIQYGDIVTYKCFDQYKPTQGNTIRTCQSNKTWSGSPPQCQREPVKEVDPVVPTTPEKKVGKKLVYPSIDAERAPEIGAAILGVTLAFVGLIFFLDISTYYHNLRTMRRNVSHFLKSRHNVKAQKQQEKDLEEWGEGTRRLNGVAKLATNNTVGDETPSTSSEDTMVQLRSCKYATRMNTTRPVGTENLSVL
ncbi:sushi, von Willebrand factor type A, EGF and pentraxin domain-containing protein 1-like isoform X2 [Lineus longissimus]|uniref:sushi, von Willebrand factor type A, EGF and pentraxin domain-containing protein 1-like isoform X2 n=1 Tax=Lineus longissimus TaxID=88925 RepID=UPI002B4C65B4